MQIIFFTLAFPSYENDRNIYSDLMEEISSHGHDIRVIIPDNGMHKIGEIWRGRIKVSYINTGRIQKSNKYFKALNTIIIEYKYKRKSKMLAKEIIPDLVIYSTPPITVFSAVKYFKKVFKCKTYLLLKDIFPANASDLEIIKRGGLIWSFFREKEKKLYSISDKIGCMSRANEKYILQNNPSLSKEKVEVCPNSIKPTLKFKNKANKEDIIAKYYIPENSLKLIYGGNLGLPQCIPYIERFLEAIKDDKSIFLIIVGDGTEYLRLEKFIFNLKLENVKIMKKLAKQDYNDLLTAMDVGMIFLDARFSVPNFPSRILDYMDYSLPILASTDRATDIKDLIEAEDCGLWSQTGDLSSMLNNIRILKSNPKERIKKGKNGRNILLSRFDVKITSDIILASVENNKS